MAKTKRPETEFSKWRKSKGLSLADVARKTGIDYMTVARWNTGVNKQPRRIYREKIREIFPDCPLAAD